MWSPKFNLVGILVLVLVMAAVLVPVSVALAGPKATATVRFGNPDPDKANRASHKLIPRTVVISEDGTVTFKVAGFHQVTVYDIDTDPDDLVIENNRVNDPTNRLFIEGAASPGPRDVPVSEFDEPGRYLVICNVTGHFETDSMFGWVIVK